MGDSGEEDGSGASSRCNAALRKQLPDVGGDGGHQTDLLPLLVFAEGIPLFSGGETALRAEADLLERHVLRGLGETRFYPLRILQLAVFGGDQPEDHLLVAGTNKAQRREIPGAVVVVLQEEGIDINAAKQHLGNRLVTGLPSSAWFSTRA